MDSTNRKGGTIGGIRRLFRAVFGGPTTAPTKVTPIDQEKLRRTVLLTMGMLVEGDYEGLQRLTGENGTFVVDIARAVDLYPDRPSMPPDEKLDELIEDCGEYVGSLPESPSWGVTVRLWINDDSPGPSEMVMLLDLGEKAGEYYEVTKLDLDVP